jgi:hypothetical protein
MDQDQPAIGVSILRISRSIVHALRVRASPRIILTGTMNCLRSRQNLLVGRKRNQSRFSHGLRQRPFDREENGATLSARDLAEKQVS